MAGDQETGVLATLVEVLNNQPMLPSNQAIIAGPSQGTAGPAEESIPKADSGTDTGKTQSDQPQVENDASAGASTGQRVLISADRMASLILEGLREIDGFPTSGVSLTVYGYQPWNAMLSFAPRSVRSAAASRYRSTLTELVGQLRSRFDIALDSRA